jgi:hypothetical protein
MATPEEDRDERVRRAVEELKAARVVRGRTYSQPSPWERVQVLAREIRENERRLDSDPEFRFRRYYG